MATGNLQSPVVIGLGGNLEATLEIFAWAARRLARLAPLHAISPLYRSQAIGPEQPDFLNAAVLLDFGDSLDLLLGLLGKIEDEAGRERVVRWGPRTLDLDILWAGDRLSSTSSLTIPHPELTRRAFALRPLLDVFPGAVDPTAKSPYRSLLGELREQRSERVEGELWWDSIERE